MAFMKKKKNKKSKKIQAVYEVGDLVLLSKKRQGIIKFIGLLHSKEGVWYGIELTDDSKGENNGHLGSNKYFKCEVKGKGIFVKPKDVIQILAKGKKKKAEKNKKVETNKKVEMNSNNHSKVDHLK